MNLGERVGYKHSIPNGVFIGNGGNMCGARSVFQLQCGRKCITLEPDWQFESWLLCV